MGTGLQENLPPWSLMQAYQGLWTGGPALSLSLSFSALPGAVKTPGKGAGTKCKDCVGTYVGGSPAQSPCALSPC